MSNFAISSISFETILNFILDTQIMGVLLGILLSFWASRWGKTTIKLAGHDNKLSVCETITKDKFGIKRAHARLSGRFQIDVFNNKSIGITLSDFKISISGWFTEVDALEVLWCEHRAEMPSDVPVDIGAQSSSRIKIYESDSCTKSWRYFSPI